MNLEGRQEVDRQMDERTDRQTEDKTDTARNTSLRIKQAFVHLPLTVL